MVEHARVFIITGAMAAGKSTIAQALACRVPKSVHVRGDVFRKMIVNGAAEMAPELSKEAIRQLHLRQDLSCWAVRRYRETGFSVVYQDILVGEGLQRVASQLSDLNPTIIALAPTVETLVTRDRCRQKTAYTPDFPAEFLAKAIANDSFDFAMRIDSSNMSVDDVVNKILACEQIQKGAGKSDPFG